MCLEGLHEAIGASERAVAKSPEESARRALRQESSLVLQEARQRRALARNGAGASRLGPWKERGWAGFGVETFMREKSAKQASKLRVLFEFSLDYQMISMS